MKRIILLALLVVAGTMIIWSQVPQAMNYKAIAKDDWGVSLPNKTITLRFTILQGSETGLIVYQETHRTTTNKFGLMDVEIGKGTPVIGSFNMIDWRTGVYYIQIEMDPNGGTSFRLEDPAHQLLSVPYAMYAGSSGNSVFSETDPVFASSPSYSILNSNIFNWNTAFGWGNHADAGYLKSFTELDPVFTAHPVFNITSENIINWSTAFSWGNHADGGYLKTEVDGSNTNEIQDLSLNGDKLTITNNALATEINLSSYKSDGSETKISAGENVSITGEGTEASPYIINSDGGNGLTIEQVLVYGNDAGSNRITNLADPLSPQDAATKATVDAMEQKIIAIMMDILDDYGFTVSVSDVDGNIYKAKKIGLQIWMAENLKTTKYNDGTEIPLITDNTEWFNLSTPGYCWYDNDLTSYRDDYGALYNWYAVNTGKVCPIGWRVPHEVDWLELVTFMGGEGDAGGSLKEEGTIYWNAPNLGATNSSGFAARGGGWRYELDGTFRSIGVTGTWWSSEGISDAEAYFLYMSYNTTEARMSRHSPKRGYSVRCIKD